MIRLSLSVGPTDKIQKEFMRGDDFGEREALRHLKLERRDHEPRIQANCYPARVLTRGATERLYASILARKS